MATRSYADVAPTAATIALNAYIYGYGGHSLVTPHTTLRQLWWTDKRIQAKITRSFVVSKLKGEERGFLDRPLAFGEGLTDDTYMEWILERAKRLFLILAEIGVPDQVFGCIDDSWDDDDLPLSADCIPNLELSYDYDPVLNKKFYDTQFVYLLRELRQGSHIDYGPKEHIPMEYFDSQPPAVSLQVWDRIFFPGKPEEIYMRRKFALTDKESGQSYREAYMRDVKKAQSLAHEHIASVWASYTTNDGAGYVISNFVGEHTLATFIDHRMSPQFAKVPAAQRPILLLEWIHCLSDALALIHSRGEAHSAIRPSNIIIDRQNRIAFSEIGSLRTFQRGKKINKTEIYEYSAPESQQSKVSNLTPSSPPVSSLSAFSKFRKFSATTNSSPSSPEGSTRSNSFCTQITAPPTPPLSLGRTNSMSRASARNFSRHLHDGPCPYPVIPFVSGGSSPTPMSQSSSFPDLDELDLPGGTPQTSDIFSLGCVYLDILTFMIKGKRTDFVKFRSAPSIATPNNKTRPRGASFTSAVSVAKGSGRLAGKPDISFHASPTRIHTWLDILDAESDKRVEPTFRGITAIIDLVRRMLSATPALRPEAMTVRDQLESILARDCQVEQTSLCCYNRVWETSLPAVPSEVGIALGGDDVSRRASAMVETQSNQVDTSKRGTNRQRTSSVRTSFIPVPPPSLFNNGNNANRNRRGSTSSLSSLSNAANFITSTKSKANTLRNFLTAPAGNRCEPTTTPGARTKTTAGTTILESRPPSIPHLDLGEDQAVPGASQGAVAIAQTKPRPSLPRKCSHGISGTALTLNHRNLSPPSSPLALSDPLVPPHLFPRLSPVSPPPPSSPTHVDTPQSNTSALSRGRRQSSAFSSRNRTRSDSLEDKRSPSRTKDRPLTAENEQKANALLDKQGSDYPFFSPTSPIANPSQTPFDVKGTILNWNEQPPAIHEINPTVSSFNATPSLPSTHIMTPSFPTSSPTPTSMSTKTRLTTNLRKAFRAGGTSTNTNCTDQPSGKAGIEIPETEGKDEKKHKSNELGIRKSSKGEAREKVVGSKTRTRAEV